MNKPQFRLTQTASGGGCACKLPAEYLEKLVSTLPKVSGGNLIVGLETGDDAAVVKLTDDINIVSTVDFFTPVVDDPFDFGRIAATNALSDIYAMGGTPTVALNLLMWPHETLPIEIATEILRGGAETCKTANTHLVGGHSIIDQEPKYGLSVTGTVTTSNLLRNDTATPGKPITLTKPIGTGILNNRHKQTGENFPEAIKIMTELNSAASQLATKAGHKTATDVTGFGLLGHLHKMMRASNISAEIDYTKIPLIPETKKSAEEGYIPGGSTRNLNWIKPHLNTNRTPLEQLILADAQTSGGLLIIGEIPGYPIIGHTTPKQPWTIQLS